jgi:putative DNA primase/helicase
MLMFELPMDRKAGTSLKRAKPVEEFVNYKSRVHNYGIVLADMLCADWDVIPTPADGATIYAFYQACQAAHTWAQKSGGTNRGEHYLFASPKYQPPLAAYKLYSTTRTTTDVKGRLRPLHMCDLKSGRSYIVGPNSIVLAESGPHKGKRGQYKMMADNEVVPVQLKGNLLQLVKAFVDSREARNAPSRTTGNGANGQGGAEYDWEIMYGWMCQQIEAGKTPEDIASEAFDAQSDICPGHQPDDAYDLYTLETWAYSAAEHTEPLLLDYGPFLKEETTMAIPIQTPSTDPEFKFNGTDDDNAVLFTRMAKGRFLYCHEENSWYGYNGTHWSAGSKEAALQLAREVARHQDKLAASIEDDSKRMNAQKNAKNAHSRRALESMVALGKGTLLTSLLNFDTDRDVLNVKNGTLNLKTGVLSPHSPTDMHSKVAPTVFDPSAKAPRWEQFLREVHLKVVDGEKVTDEEGITFFQRFMGYSITGHIREQAMLICHGEKGENGKSTEIEAISGVVGGDYSVALDPAVLLASSRDGKSADSSVARLRGARLAYLSEPKHSSLDLATFKRLTGDSVIPSRDLYCKAIEFKATHTFTMLCNDRPTISETNDATWSRLRTLPYIAKFKRDSEDSDKRLGETLAAEASGILNWLLVGSMAWYKNGLSDSTVITEANAEYRKDQNPLTAFVDDCYEEKASGRVKGSEMYKTYKEWATANGMKKIMSGKEFHKNMELTYTRKQMAGIDTYFGLVSIVKV